jgi:hypothetical protein
MNQTGGNDKFSEFHGEYGYHESMPSMVDCGYNETNVNLGVDAYRTLVRE